MFHINQNVAIKNENNTYYTANILKKVGSIHYEVKQDITNKINIINKKNIYSINNNKFTTESKIIVKLNKENLYYQGIVSNRNGQFFITIANSKLKNFNNMVLKSKNIISLDIKEDIKEGIKEEDVSKDIKEYFKEEDIKEEDIKLDDTQFIKIKDVIIHKKYITNFINIKRELENETNDIKQAELQKKLNNNTTKLVQSAIIINAKNMNSKQVTDTISNNFDIMQQHIYDEVYHQKTVLNEHIYQQEKLFINLYFRSVYKNKIELKIVDNKIINYLDVIKNLSQVGFEQDYLTKHSKLLTDSYKKINSNIKKTIDNLNEDDYNNTLPLFQEPYKSIFFKLIE